MKTNVGDILTDLISNRYSLIDIIMKMFFTRKYYLICVHFVVCLVTMAFYNNHRKQVICFGDSITQGSEKNGGGWVAILSVQHPDIDFINVSRNGRKTADKAELLPVLEKYPKADDYLIFLGVNDLKDGNDSMVNNCVQNVKWMIAELRKKNANAHIVLLAPPDINLKTMSEINVQKKYNSNTQRSLHKLFEQYKALATREKLGFISLLNCVSKENYLDGLHPDTNGQTEIAECVWKKLEQIQDK